MTQFAVPTTGGGVFFAAPAEGSFSGLIGGGASPDAVLYQGATATLSAGWTQGFEDNFSFAWTTITGSGSLLGSSSFIGGGPVLAFNGTPDANGIVNLGGADGFVEGISFADVGLTANESIRFDWANGSVTFQTISAIPEPGSAALLTIAGGLLALRRRKA